MAVHPLMKASARDLTLDHVDLMSETDVRTMFSRLRWGSEYQQICPECGTIASHYWKPSRKQWQCREKGCWRTFSLLSGTKFEDSKLKLKKLLRIILYFALSAKGTSAIQASRHNGVSHKTTFVLMHKIREALMVDVSSAKLTGVVHVDGTHVGGKTRKSNIKAPNQLRQQRDRISDIDSQSHKNRRILEVARSVEAGYGGVCTRVAVVRTETAEHVVPFVNIHVEDGATLHTDENPGYNSLGGTYDHQTVNHSKEFQTKKGINNNQAESYNTRFKRLYFGQIHRLGPKYVFDYASEIAWREDTRKDSALKLIEDILRAVLTSGTSAFWRGYHQGHHRQEEILFPTTVGDAIKKARENLKLHAINMCQKYQREKGAREKRLAEKRIRRGTKAKT